MFWYFQELNRFSVINELIFPIHINKIEMSFCDFEIKQFMSAGLIVWAKVFKTAKPILTELAEE